MFMCDSGVNSLKALLHTGLPCLLQCIQEGQVQHPAYGWVGPMMYRVVPAVRTLLKLHNSEDLDSTCAPHRWTKTQ